MARLRLFDENDKRTPIAKDITKEVRPIVREIFDKYFALGYSIRDISYVLTSEVKEQELIMILKKCRS